MIEFAHYLIESKSFKSIKIGIMQLSKTWILIAAYAIFLWREKGLSIKRISRHFWDNQVVR
jgi:hypothetical protein